MKNKVKLIVNPFIRIAGGQALIWGFLGLIVSTLLLDIGLSLSWFASFWTGPQSGLVVLSGGTSDCVADSCTALLSGRSFSVSFPHSCDRCTGYCFVCSAAVAWNESDQPVAGHADDVTNEHEYVSRRNAGTALFYPGNDSYTVGIAVSDTYFDLDV